MGREFTHTVKDWLHLHELDRDLVLQIVSQIPDASILEKFSIDIGSFGNDDKPYDLDKSLEDYVIPSLVELVGDSHDLQKSLHEVPIHQSNPQEFIAPYTHDKGVHELPEITMLWSGQAKDILCLTHEMAHAAQIILSSSQFMSPIAREICAFLGELSLIDYVHTRDKNLYQALCRVWHLENPIYLRDDVGDLKQALSNEQNPYHYRLNYPLARLLAMFYNASLSQKQTQALFINTFPALQKPQLEKAYLAFERLNDEGAQPAQRDFRVSKWASLRSYKNGLKGVNPFQIGVRIGGHGTLATKSPLLKGEDALSLLASLSPDAFEIALSGQVDPQWFFQNASTGVIGEDQAIQDVAQISPQYWIKWRSLGIMALGALKRKEANLKSGDFLRRYESLANEEPALVFSDVSPWVKPLPFDMLTALGLAIHHLAQSPYHRQFPLFAYLPIEILPPLRAGQLRSYIGINGEPFGMIAWAKLSDDIRDDVHASGRPIQPNEWCSGPNPFVNDWISEAPAFAPMKAEIRDTIFPNDIFTSIRRNSNGSVRRVNRWRGRDWKNDGSNNAKK